MMRLRHQAGMTLIELMIAGLLGIIITFFVVNIMVNSNSIALNSNTAGQSQEGGRFIMSWLQAESRRAGYSSIAGSTEQINPFADRCIAGAAIPPADGGNCTYESTVGIGDNDRLAIQWVYNPSSTTARDQQDCTGAAIVLATETLLVDVYWIVTGGANSGYDDTLNCVTYNADTGIALNNSQSIAAGIIGMQVLYGVSTVATPTDETNVSRYVNASQVDPDANIDDDDVWGSVQAVRIALLTRAFSDSGLSEEKRSYILLDANPYSYDDRISRYIQLSTTALPNN